MITCGNVNSAHLEAISVTATKEGTLAPSKRVAKNGNWFRQRNWCIEGDRVKGIGSWRGNGRDGKSDRKRGAVEAISGCAAGRTSSRDKEEIIQSAQATVQSSDLICFQELFYLLLSCCVSNREAAVGNFNPCSATSIFTEHHSAVISNYNN